MKIVRVILGIVSILIFAAVLYSNFKKDKSNDLIGEAMATAAKGDEHMDVIRPKLTELETDEAIAGFPGNRDKFKAQAAEVADGFSKAAEAYRQGAAKFGQAAAESIDDVVAENLRMREQWLAKLADSREEYRKAMLLWTDESIKEQDEFFNKRNELILASNNLYKESSDFADKFKQHIEAHGDKFE